MTPNFKFVAHPERNNWLLFSARDKTQGPCKCKWPAIKITLLILKIEVRKIQG